MEYVPGYTSLFALDQERSIRIGIFLAILMLDYLKIVRQRPELGESSEVGSKYGVPDGWVYS